MACSISVQAPAAAADEAAQRRDLLKRLKPGLTADEVRQILGPPKRVARQILYMRYREMWTYEVPFDLLIDFDGRKGASPRLISVHAAAKDIS
jgi:hypothetical protein